MCKVIICGGRDYNNKDFIVEKLNQFHKQHTITTLIEGGANGVDFLARCWAINNNISYKTFKADWKSHGKSAGPKRNAKMLLECPDFVIAFKGGAGTNNMLMQAQQANIKTIIFLEGA